MWNLRNGKRMSPATLIIAVGIMLAVGVGSVELASQAGLVHLPNGNPQFNESGEIVESTTKSAPTSSQSNADWTDVKPIESQSQTINPDMRDAVERAICMVMLSGPDVTAPTDDFPFGGYEGYVFNFLVVNNLWESVDVTVRTDDACGVLTDAERDHLVLNLVNEARRQAGSDLNLTFMGQVVTVDLSLAPTRNGMVTPYRVPAPSGSVVESDGNEANGDFDGSAHSTNPQLGTPAPQQTEASGGTVGGDLGGNVEQQPSSRTGSDFLPPIMGEGIGPVFPQMNSLPSVPSAGNEFGTIHPFN